MNRTINQKIISIIEYYNLGCSKFIIRGIDPLEDTIDFGKELIPLIKEKSQTVKPTTI